MKKFNIKVGDRKFIVSADNEAKAVKKLKDAQVKKMSDAHTRIKVGCAEITVNNEAKAYSVGSVAWFNGRDERTFRDYAKQCIDVANKIKELESKGYKEDVMKAYDSALKDADDYSYEVIKGQINSEGFSKDLLLKKAYNGLTRGSMNKDEYKRLVEEIKAVKDRSCVKDADKKDIEFIMKDYVQKHFLVKKITRLTPLKYEVEFDDDENTKATIVFDDKWDEWVYTINGHGPISHSSYEYLISDLQKYGKR